MLLKFKIQTPIHIKNEHVDTVSFKNQSWAIGWASLYHSVSYSRNRY